MRSHRVRVVLAVASASLLVGCSVAQPSDPPGPTEVFSLDGGPVGLDIDQAVFTIPDGSTPVRMTVMTMGPNPPGSPSSCAGPDLPSTLRYVPVAVNATPAEAGKPASDVKVTLVITSGGTARPLLLVTDYADYQASCPSTPVLMVDGLRADTQLILRGVAVVAGPAGSTATLTLTQPDGRSQQASIRV